MPGQSAEKACKPAGMLCAWTVVQIDAIYTLVLPSTRPAFSQATTISHPLSRVIQPASLAIMTFDCSATFIVYVLLSCFDIITERERDVVRFTLDLVSCYVSATQLILFYTRRNN
jgi:hypothetical protein